MGLPRQSVRAGQRLETFPYQAWNDFLRAAGDLAERDAVGHEPDGVDFSDGTTILVQNNTGGDIGACAVLAVGAPMASPVTSLGEVIDQPNLVGTLPVGGDAVFCVTQEPIAAGGLGRAKIAGVTWVQVNVTTAAHRYAIPIASDATKLASAPAGGARMLWQDAGTGIKWALARLGASDTSSTMLAITTSAITARVGSQLGQGTAELQKIPGGLLTDASAATEIYSPFYHVIPTGVAVELNRDAATGLLYVVWPDAQLKTDCFNGYLAILQSVDGGLTFAFHTYVGGCQSIICPACGSGSGSGGCPCVEINWCVSFPGVTTGTVGSCCPPLIDPMTLNQVGDVPCSWDYGYEPCGSPATNGVLVYLTYTPGQGMSLQVTIGNGLSYSVNVTYKSASDLGCVSSQTLHMQAGSIQTGCANFPATITITSGTCGSGSGSGSGSSGGCSITRTQLLATTQTNTLFSDTVPGTIPAGAKLIVKVGMPNQGINNLPATATFDGNAMTKDLSDGLQNMTDGVSWAIFSLTIASPITNGTLVVNDSGGILNLFMVVAIQEVGLAGNAHDAGANASGKNFSGSLDTGFSGPTALACEISEACFVMMTPGVTGTWQNGYSAGTGVVDTFAGNTYQLIEGYRILNAITAVDAANSQTAAIWAGGEACYY